MDMKRLFASVFILSLSTVLMAQQAIDLSGQWSFKTGGDDIPAERVAHEKHMGLAFSADI